MLFLFILVDFDFYYSLLNVELFFKLLTNYTDESSSIYALSNVTIFLNHDKGRHFTNNAHTISDAPNIKQITFYYNVNFAVLIAFPPNSIIVI